MDLWDDIVDVVDVGPVRVRRFRKRFVGDLIPVWRIQSGDGMTITHIHLHLHHAHQYAPPLITQWDDHTTRCKEIGKELNLGAIFTNSEGKTSQEDDFDKTFTFLKTTYISVKLTNGE